MSCSEGQALKRDLKYVNKPYLILGQKKKYPVEGTLDAKALHPTDIKSTKEEGSLEM